MEYEVIIVIFAVIAAALWWRRSPAVAPSTEIVVAKPFVPSRDGRDPTLTEFVSLFPTVMVKGMISELRKQVIPGLINEQAEIDTKLTQIGPERADAIYGLSEDDKEAKKAQRRILTSRLTAAKIQELRAAHGIELLEQALAATNNNPEVRRLRAAAPTPHRHYQRSPRPFRSPTPFPYRSPTCSRSCRRSRLS